MQANITWRELLIRLALIFICLGLWYNKLNIVTFPLLGLAWLLDDGYNKFRQLIKEPLVQAILVLCAVLVLGLLWSDHPDGGRHKWLKYFILLNFIPFFSLLNKKRLPWAFAALLFGYFGVLCIGIYQWAVLGGQGVPLFKMTYLSFSAMLGIGVIISFYFACTSSSKKISILSWVLMLTLLFVQFNQNGRSLLLATLITLSLLILLLYWAELRKFMIIFVSLTVVISVFAFSSNGLQDRLSRVKHDIEQLQQGDYSTSLGYRLAMWDVGLNGIATRPLFGHGTGMPESYFNETIKTYKGGVYKDLKKFQRTSHYHNDWIEMGMHLGLLGILALTFLLWSWYQTFKVHHLRVLGIALVSYIFLAGLTDAFIIYSRIPMLLLVITAITISWQEEN
tara:strand:- start:372 stop:1553 length:1182 start_codon:yes stop_codon:yes gene_type:complete